MKQLRIGYLSTMYHTSHILRGDSAQPATIRAAQWILFGTGPSMVDAFSRGELDLGYIGLPPAMIGISRGLPLVCIAGGHIEGTVLVGPPSLPCAAEPGAVPEVFGCLAGKRIGAPARGSIHDIILRHCLAVHGIQAQVVNFPWADLMPQAIAEGAIAAAAGTPPLAAVAGEWYGCNIIIPPRLLWPFNPSYGIVVRTSLLPQRDFLEQFVRSHEAACNLTRERPEEAARITAGEVNAVSADFIKKVFAISPHYCAALPAQYRAAAMAFVPVLQQQGAMAGQLSEDRVFDLSIISRVHGPEDHY